MSVFTIVTLTDATLVFPPTLWCPLSWYEMPFLTSNPLYLVIKLNKRAIARKLPPAGANLFFVMMIFTMTRGHGAVHRPRKRQRATAGGAPLPCLRTLL